MAVLIISGCFGLITIYANSLSNLVKSKLEIQLILNPSINDAKALIMQKDLQTKPYAASIDFVSKEEALKIMSQTLGENIQEFAGENPFFSSFLLTLEKKYAHADSLIWIKNELLAFKGVSEVYFQDNILDLVNKNIKNISYVFLAFGSMLLLLAITLINNAIKLHLHAQRFLIKTMQLVGATRFFIQKPYLGRAIFQGLIAALGSIASLYALLHYVQNAIPEIAILRNPLYEVYVFAAVLLFGFAISFLSTYFAVSKYIKLRTEELY